MTATAGHEPLPERAHQEPRLPLRSGVFADSWDGREHVASEYRALEQLAGDCTRDVSYAFPK